MKTRDSQNRKVLAWLLKGRTITAEQAKAKWGIARLAARIYDINGMDNPADQGWPGLYCVKPTLIYVRNRDGKKVRVARYSL